METEQRRRTDSEKSMRKQERRIKEISFAAEEDRKTHDGLREQLDKFNTRVRILKRQLEEAVSPLLMYSSYYVSSQVETIKWKVLNTKSYLSTPKNLKELQRQRQNGQWWSTFCSCDKNPEHFNHWRVIVLYSVMMITK